ncbi:hypothetical protein BDY24DRAFT_412551 [Mrakia frigida]|uniref:Zn(II)2Cys6 transcription factor n=1 Tax=Mrakia frigida TaxID=29902 RepID=UPI003FCBFDB7
MKPKRDSKGEKKPRKALSRWQACKTCRDRKLRCDASKPCCKTCEKSWIFHNNHLKTGQLPLPYPQCLYEEIPEPIRIPKQGEVVADRSPPLASPLPPAPSSFNAEASNFPVFLPADPFYSFQAPSLSSPSFGSTPQTFDPLFFAQQPDSTSFPFDDLASSSSPFDSFFLPSSNIPPPLHISTSYQSNTSTDYYSPSKGRFHSEHSSPDSEGSASKRARLDASREVDEGELNGFLAELGIDLTAPAMLLGTEAVLDDEEELQEVEIEEEVGGAGTGTGRSGSSSEERFLLDLLWPGWPSHLPPPGKLEHIVNTFFKVSPYATQLFNKARLLARLNLPPSHHDFPHPALLHSICAATSSFIGGVNLVPPAACDFNPARDGTANSSRNELPSQAAYPAWDGLGAKPNVTTPGLDGDFGQVHATWAQLYIDQAKDRPFYYLEATQALVILLAYYHQQALFFKVWTIIGLATRLAVPLGLDAPFDDRRPSAKSAQPHLDGRTRDFVLKPPKDDIERIERQNLLWIIFSFDTYASNTTGWQGAMQVENMRLSIPTSHATTSSDRAFPPNRLSNGSSARPNSFSLSIQGTLLLRKVVDFVRDCGKDGDPRETLAFRDLDELITSYAALVPSISNDQPSLSTTNDGMAVDRDLLVAQALPHVSRLTLHCPFSTHPPSPTDRYTRHVNEAVLGLSAQIQALSLTNFEFGYLPPFLTYSWFTGAKTLLKPLQYAISNADISQAQILLAQIGVFRSGMARVGEKLPLGVRQCSMLDKLLGEILSPSMATGSRLG